MVAESSHSGAPKQLDQTKAGRVNAEMTAGMTGVSTAETTGELDERMDAIAETTGELDERMDAIAELPWRDYGRDGYLDSEEESDRDYIDAGLADEKSRSGNACEDSARTQRNSARQQPNSASHWNPANPPPDRRSRVSRSSDRHDNYGRRADSRERPQYGPCAACGGQGHSVHFCRCKFCQQVHDVGRCELFQRYERLANFVTQNVDKSKLPTDLQDLYTPNNLNLAARQH
ncbi:unnamed protein product [Phytophthora fragariaefolia]|uniref:Unnamed protein product n=1 Tax=Phytophthora fragariaefolia TaxID=1490495 RepID=A0A9W7DAB2_9STRA|nr:unnamed protein product [Phytophthora fragariaefolia]